MTNLFVVINLT